MSGRHPSRADAAAQDKQSAAASAARAVECQALQLLRILTGRELERLRGGESTSQPQSAASAATAPSTPPLAARRGRLLHVGVGTRGQKL